MPSLDPADKDWDKELQNGSNGVPLPDCRVKPIERHLHRVPIGRLEYDKVFCAQCGKPTGACPPGQPFVFFICDDCVNLFGAPPECVEVAQGS